MSQLDQIVNVTITTTPAPLSTTNYGVPLILGSTAPGWSDVAHTYTSPAGMLTDGYVTSSPEYIAALALYDGQITPSQFLVAPRTHADAAQVDTFDLGATVGNNAITAGTVFSFTVDGTLVSYTTQTNDTSQQVLGSFASQLNALGKFTTLIANSGGIKVLNVTVNNQGENHVYTSVSSNVNHVASVQAAGIGNDLAALAPLGNSWYGLLTPGVTMGDALQAAAWVEANKKLYVLSSSAANNFTPSTPSSLAAKLQAAGYRRTAFIPSIASYTSGVDAAWMGSNLPLAPGSNNWAYSSLPGQVADSLSDTQISAALAANANVFVNIAGANCTLYGTTASGDYIDNIIGQDWLQSTIQANCFDIIRNAAARGSKIPYTDAGAAQIGQGVYAALRAGIEAGFIDGTQDYSVVIPKVASVSPTLKAKRQCPPITFTCVLAGAIDKVTINGTLDI